MIEITNAFPDCTEVQQYGLQLLGRLSEEGVNLLVLDDSNVVNAVLNLDTDQQLDAVVKITVSSLSVSTHRDVDYRAFSQVLAGIVRVNESAKKGVIVTGYVRSYHSETHHLTS